jgi:hypothetical protein
MGPTFRILGGIIFFTFLLTPGGVGQEPSNYLVLNDINGFRASKNPSAGQGPGILAGAGHFYEDHKDMTYRISYFNVETRVGPSVQVTQHVGGDSDKWLLHELDAEFRNYYGLPGKSYFVRKINGNVVVAYGAGGWNYRWLSDKKLVVVEYTDLEMSKPEPIEVVQAYLDKLPSTLPGITSTIQRSQESVTTWIKDEMERRLWLCDKWFLQVQVGKAEMSEALQMIVKCLNIFLDYREKYYGVAKADEKAALWGYLDKKDGTSIKNKLMEYKNWWNANKARSINLP